MPKPQKDPPWVRIVDLAKGGPLVVEIDWGAVTPSSLDPAERDGVEDVADLVKEATPLLQCDDGSVDDLVVEGALTELGDRIGAKLRALNATGVYIRADRRSGAHARRRDWHRRDGDDRYRAARDSPALCSGSLVGGPVGKEAFFSA